MLSSCHSRAVPGLSRSFSRMTQVFLSRLASTLVLWTAVLWTIFSGHELGFFAMLSAVGLAALWEFYRMLDRKAFPISKSSG